jgi:hypothetical protein
MRDGSHDGGVRDEEVVSVDLTQAEFHLLRAGLSEWGGPATPTDYLARLLGSAGLEDLDADLRRLRQALAKGPRLSRADWRRVLLATEIVFISDVVGSGRDWSITTGMADDESLWRLRSIQKKLASVIR